jgi:hypothetical protein
VGLHCSRGHATLVVRSDTNVKRKIERTGGREEINKGRTVGGRTVTKKKENSKTPGEDEEQKK